MTQQKSKYLTVTNMLFKIYLLSLVSTALLSATAQADELKDGRRMTFMQHEEQEVRKVDRDNEVYLRTAGDDGVKCYRIPGVDTTRKGSLIAVYDIRHRSGRDLPGDIDVGMSRSTDGGKTWEPMKVIMDMGSDPEWKHDGIGDPCVAVDRETGTIWVAALWSHGNRAWHGSGTGMKPDETGQVILVRSDDDGKTWSDPINITNQIKDPKWRLILPSPGRGMTMTDGTLVLPMQ